MEFLCNGLRPIIDGKIKPDHLKLLLEIELEAMEEEHERPVSVLTKAADAMPGFGIVAAVLGHCASPWRPSPARSKQIGEKVAAALVGTFLGIFLSYGFMNPLAVNMEFISMAEMAYIRCIAASVIGFASGMSPIMAVEVARRGLSSEVKPSADALGGHAQGLEPDRRRQMIARHECQKSHHGGAWKVAYADFTTAMMALFIVLWLTSQDQRIKDAVERAFRNPFSSVTKESTGIIPNKEIQGVKADNGNFDLASAMELKMLRRLNQDLHALAPGRPTRTKARSNWI